MLSTQVQISACNKDIRYKSVRIIYRFPSVPVRTGRIRITLPDLGPRPDPKDMKVNNNYAHLFFKEALQICQFFTWPSG